MSEIIGYERNNHDERTDGAPLSESYGAKSWIVAFVVAFLLFSPYSYAVFDVSGLYAFEIALLCAALVLFLTRSTLGVRIIFSVRASLSSLVIPFAVIAATAIVGWAHYGQPGATYADARANAFVVVGFFVSSKLLQKYPWGLYVVASCAVVWSVVYWCNLYSIGDTTSKYPTPLYAAVTAFFVAIRLNRIQAAGAMLCATFFLAAISGFRQYWIVAALVLIPAVTAILFRRTVPFKSKALVLLVLCLASYFGSHFLWNYINQDQSRYIQTVGKTKDALAWASGGEASGSDSLRMAYFEYMAVRAQDLVLPHGLGYEAQGQQFDPWFNHVSETSNTIDSAALFVSYQYGYIVFVPLLALLAVLFIRTSRRRGTMQSTVLLTIFFVPILFDGGQLTVTIRAFWFGSFLALLTTEIGSLSFKRRVGTLSAHLPNITFRGQRTEFAANSAAE